MILSVSRHILRPLSGVSRQVFNPKSAATLPSSLKCLLSSSSSLFKDKSDEGNPFSVDDMYLSSSKKNLKHFDVPDPIEEKSKLPENLNEGEIILKNAKKNLENFDIPDPLHHSKQLLNEARFNNSVATNDNIVEEEEEGYMNDDDIAAEILDIALEFVPTHGWTQKTIDAAVEALELSPSTAGMFKRGPADLVLHFIETSNAKLFENLAAESKRFDARKSTLTSDFIEKAIKERLEMVIPFIDSWPQALTLLTTPSIAAEVLEQGANMVDEIWYHAGDMSSDMNWYTKRAAVAALHLSAELFLLQDKSAGYADTWEFLHRRVKDVETAAFAKNSIDHALQDALNIVGAGFTTVQNIFGLNNRSR